MPPPLLQVAGVRHRIGPPPPRATTTPAAVEQPADPDLWAHDQFQLLVVAAEYVAALQEVGRQRCHPGPGGPAG